ncbi:MAG: glycosyltransferase family 2 protein [Deltaproteobacteria bacterium]|nr:glycosyltransferase family 2 protein [Candidatus Desulfobacula maris]
MLDYSVIIPFYNEEENIPPMLEKVSVAMNGIDGSYEIIAVDDGSSDATFSRLKEGKQKYPNLKIIKFRRNFGQTPAMQAGIDHASGGIIITMDGDLQNDPEDIHKLLEKMKEGYDVVSGWRKKRKDNILRCIPSKVANFLLTYVTGVKIHDNGCSLKVYNAKILKQVRLYSEMHRFITAFAFLRGAKVAELVVKHHPRTLGVSKYGFSRIWKVFIDLFTLKLVLNFSERPMVWFGAMSFVSIFISMAMLFYRLIFWSSQIVWPGLILFFAFNAFVLLGYGLVCELAVHFAGRINYYGKGFDR